MLPVKFRNAIQPYEAKSNVPVSKITITETPFTVKSLGLDFLRYKVTDNNEPDFTNLTNLKLLDSGVTPYPSFYVKNGAPAGLTITDNFAVKYTGYFYTGNSTSVNFRLVGYGKAKLIVNGNYLAGGSLSYTSLSDTSYNDSTISVAAGTWVTIEIQYWSEFEESGFAILYKDASDTEYIPLSAGVTSRTNSFIESNTVLDLVSDTLTYSSSQDVNTFTFKIPFGDSGSNSGYYYDKYNRQFIHNNTGLKIKKNWLIESYVGYKDDPKILHLTTSNYASITHANQTGLAIPDTSDFMYETWLRVSDTSNEGYIMSKWSGASGGVMLRYKSTGELFFRIGGNSSNYATAETIEKVNDNKWHHVCAYVDKNLSNGIHIFIDGVEATYSNNTSPVFANNIDAGADFMLGNTTSSYNSEQYLKEVRVWDFGNGGLPANIDEIIKDHYDYPYKISTKVNSTYLKARWTMQEDTSTATSITDTTGYNDLTAVGSPLLLFESVSSFADRAIRTSDDNYTVYIRKFIGHIKKFNIKRDYGKPDVVEVTCDSFESLLKETINLNYPDKLDYWVSGYAGYNGVPDGLDYPPTFDGWPIDKAFRTLLYRGVIDPTLCFVKRKFLDSNNSQVTGNYLINGGINLDRARNYGNPNSLLTSEQPDDEYVLKSNFGDNIFDYLNKMVEPYGWEWNISAYYGAPYLTTRNNPTTIYDSEEVSLNGTGWSAKQVDLDAVGGTYRETSTSGDFIEKQFTGTRIDMINVGRSLSGGAIGMITSGSATQLRIEDVTGSFSAGNAIVIDDIYNGSLLGKYSVIQSSLGNNEYTISPALDFTPASGTMVRTAVAKAEIRQGSTWTGGTTVSEVYIPAYYDNDLDKYIQKFDINTGEMVTAKVPDISKRFYYHGYDRDNGINPMQRIIATGLPYEPHVIRITRLTDAEAQAGTIFGFNGLFVYDDDKNLPVYTFRSGDSVVSGTLVQLDVNDSLEDHRNDVVVVGRRIGLEVPGDESSPINPNNPTSRFIISRAIDSNAIYSPDSVNFVGRPIQTILIEPSIASQDRADYWAVEFLNRYRFPGKFGKFAALGNPLIEEGDCVYFYDEYRNSIDNTSRIWIENISTSWGDKKSLDNYETVSYPPWPSYQPKKPVDIADFGNSAVYNFSLNNNGSLDSPYDPYSSEETGKLVEINFDLVISGFVRIEVYSYNGIKVADLLNPNGDEGQKGWIKDTFGSNKKVTWDGVDSYGIWNSTRLDFSDDKELLRNWYVAEEQSITNTAGNAVGKFYIVITVKDENDNIYVYDSSESGQYIYTRRGNQVSLTVTTTPGTYTPGDYDLNRIPVGFDDDDNSGKGFKLDISTSRKSQLSIETAKAVYGLYVYDFGASGSEAYRVAAPAEETTVVERNEFLTYTNHIEYYDPKDYNNIFNDWVGNFSEEYPQPVTGATLAVSIGWYFVFRVTARDKSGRQDVVEIAQYWHGDDVNRTATYYKANIEWKNVEIAGINIGDVYTRSI